MKRTWHILALAVLGGLLVAGCDDDSNPLAPYRGQRPLTLQRVTISATPDLQWVGGRVAAVGVNLGTTAALDSTLVWMIRADEDAISSAVTVGEAGDDAFVQNLGGTPVDSLPNGEEYTFWIAERSVLDAGLEDGPPSGPLGVFGFADTTFTLSYMLRGRSGGDPAFLDEIRIIRNQRLTSDAYSVTWTPEVGVRRLAIRQGSSGAFTDLVWDILVEEDDENGIRPPVTIGALEPPSLPSRSIPARRPR